MSDGDTLIGRTLEGRYTVNARIGSGGMSSVYEALDTQLGRKVAVKIFNPGEARDDDRRRSEVDVLARLNHPNLVTMYDAHLASGGSTVPSFLVMELITGPDLRSTLDHGALRGAIAAQITTDIAEALAAMHAQGIVHRDLKPANILLSPTGLPEPAYRAKLADFGIAHLVGTDRMTTVGTIVGTASYLSPEQAAGAAPGPEADIYALGLVVLEGLTGHREYPGTVIESMSARASRDPVVSDDLPPSWVALITQMTARAPDARPTALEVATRSRDITADLASWQPPAGSSDPDPAAASATTVATAGATGAATAAMLPPTRKLPVSPTPVDTAGVATAQTTVLNDAAPVATPPRRRARPALIVTGAIVLLGAAIWAGGALLPQALAPGAGQPAPVPVETSATPSPDSGTTTVVDPAATTTPSDDSGSTPLPTETPTAATASPTATATATTPPSPSTSPAPTGNGNGNGNNGNGNNGNGNGKGNGKG
ncbi:MAG: hypothetical protein JWQ19_3680 [Subtercola sp.]|nr:hypothetical protein [Subtercola sp.]